MSITTTGVSSQDVLRAITEVLDANHQKLTAATDRSRGLSLPLSPRFITSEFGEGAYQMKSGFSIVVKSQQTVYKHVYSPRTYDTLLRLLGKNLQLERSLLPLGFNVVKECSYFKYNLLLMPLTKDSAKLHIKSLVNGIVLALNELHSQGLAHLDIRLENVCFHPQSKAPILIELDQSVE